MLWLEACSSNKNPRIVAKFYMDAVTELKGVIKFVRGSRDVENIFVAGIQRFKNCNQRNSYRSLLFGKSTSNQRLSRSFYP